jgi:hypothetical protein
MLEEMYVHLENRKLASFPPKIAGIDHSMLPRGQNMHTPVPCTERCTICVYSCTKYVLVAGIQNRKNADTGDSGDL